MAKAVIEGGGYVEPKFVPAKTIVDQYGEKVAVDKFGRDSSGDIVIAMETPEDTKARQAANVGMGLAPSGNQLSGRTITRNAAVRTENGVKIFTREVVDAETGEVLRTFDEAEKPAAAATSATSSTGAGASTSAQENAIELLKRQFANYGIESLAGTITDLVRKGYSGDTVSMMLQDSPEYKKRFAANDARKKAGLSVLSPAEYLAAEESYRNVMRQAGLPSGFYDSQDDYANFIANDVSSTEVGKRLDMARNAVANMDQTYIDQLKKYYNMTTGQLVAYALDPKTALPLLERQTAAVNIGVAAAQQGISPSVAKAEYYAGLGLSEAEARAGFASMARTQPTYEKLSQIYGNMPAGGTTESLMAATFGGEAQAEEQQRLLQLKRREQGMFSGAAGIGQTAFGTSETSGQL